VNIGHPCADVCPNPQIVKDFVVIHTNGIHTVSAYFCDCSQRGSLGEWRQQLLRRHWFPSTHLEPSTASTFELLNQFHLLTLQGKVTTYDYYTGLKKLTNNTGVGLKLVSLYSFYLFIR
jgi:hypothetical protein